MDGPALCLTSPFLLRERFVVGFGGYARRVSDEMYVYDTLTRRWSSLERGGEWHPPDHSVVAAARGDAVYILGGVHSTGMYSISLGELSRRVQRTAVRVSLQAALGLPLTVNADKRFAECLGRPPCRL